MEDFDDYIDTHSDELEDYRDQFDDNDFEDLDFDY